MNIMKEVSWLVKLECKKESNPYGYLSSWKHMNHVVKFAKHLAKGLEADEEIVELAARLHDWGAIQGFRENHHITGSNAAEEILKRFNYPEERIERVKYCIFTHRSSQNIKPVTDEAKCVANADGIAHFFEIPDMLCSMYYRNKEMIIEEVVARIIEKLERDWKKMTLIEAKRIARPYREAAKTILKF